MTTFWMTANSRSQRQIGPVLKGSLFDCTTLRQWRACLLQVRDHMPCVSQLIPPNKFSKMVFAIRALMHGPFVTAIVAEI